MKTTRCSFRGSTCVRAGIWGAVVAAICCTTPLLAIGLAAIGLATLVPHLDYILFPALLFFLALAFYGWKKS